MVENYRKLRILIPGNFEVEHFTKAQENYVSLLANTNNALVVLHHVSCSESLPATENQVSLLRTHGELSKRVEHNMRMLRDRLAGQDLEVHCTVSVYGNIRNELFNQIETVAPDFTILKLPDQIKYRYLTLKTPVLFVPETPPQRLPEKMALFLSEESSQHLDKGDFFFSLTRKITGQLSVIRTHDNGAMADSANFQKELNALNLSHGINFHLIEQQNSASLNIIQEFIHTHQIDLPFIIHKNGNGLSKLMSPSQRPLKKLLKESTQPLFCFC